MARATGPKYRMMIKDERGCREEKWSNAKMSSQGAAAVTALRGGGGGVVTSELFGVTTQRKAETQETSRRDEQASYAWTGVLWARSRGSLIKAGRRERASF